MCIGCYSTLRFDDDLNVGGVQHNSDGSAKGLGRQVLLEVCSDDTVSAVRSDNLSPDDSDLGASNFLGSSVNVGDSLTEVEVGLLGRGDTLDLDQRDVGVNNALGALVGQVLSLDVQSV